MFRCAAYGLLILMLSVHVSYPPAVLASRVELPERKNAWQGPTKRKRRK